MGSIELKGATRKIEVYIGADGTAECVYDPHLLPLVAKLGGQVERISHIEPTGWSQRWLFHRIRGCFGDDGRMAAWTRRWRCLWRVNFAPTGGDLCFANRDGKPFRSHAAAVAYEAPIALQFVQGLKGVNQDARSLA